MEHTMTTPVNANETLKKVALIQAWEDWDENDKRPAVPEGPKLCKIENPDCEACQ